MIPHLKLCKRILYASSYAAKIIFSARSVFYASVWKHKIVTMPHLKICTCSFYDSSHDEKRFLSYTYTPICIQEQVCTFVHTMNYLVIRQHNQNNQMRSQNLMLKQILATVVVNVPLQIPYVPDIKSLKNISTTSTSDITHTPTYEHLHRNFLPEREGKNKLVPY